MTILSNELHAQLDQINKSVQELLKELEGSKVSVSIKRASEKYTQQWNRLNNSEENREISEEQIENIVKSICLNTEVIVNNLLKDNDISQPLRDLATKVFENSRDLINRIDNEKVTFEQDANIYFMNSVPEYFHSSGQDAKKYLNKMTSEFEAERKRNSNSLASIQNKIEDIEQKGNKISSTIDSELAKIKSLYEESKEFLETKRQEVNELTESIAKDAYSGNYEIRASKEESVANHLRYLSLWAMVGAIIVIVVTVIEASIHNYTWTSALLRIGLIFAVSLPAAYLARESARHRDKQNSYMERSLDLKAVSPFISSLEKADQDKIKIDLSDRLFASKNHSVNEHDDIPLNAIEAALKIIEKSQKK